MSPLIRLVASLTICGTAVAVAADEPKFRLPPGFEIDAIADELPGARSLAWGEAGTLFVGTRGGDRVYALRGALSDAPEPVVVAEGLQTPNGVAFRDGTLLVEALMTLVDVPEEYKLTDNIADQLGWKVYEK